MKMMITTAALLGLAAAARAQSTRPAAADDTSTVTAEGIVQAPSAEIWRVFSTPEGFKALGVAQCKMDFRQGGLILSAYDPKANLDTDPVIKTEILAFEPGRVLVTRIHAPPKGFPFMEAYKHVWSVITLTAVDEGRTNVRITMVGYGPDEESQKMRDFFRTGNAWVIKKLQSAYVPDAAPKGAAHADRPTAPIELTQIVSAPREDVWKTYTTSDGWSSFFMAGAQIGVVPGQPFEPFKGTEGNSVLATVPGEMLAHTWNAPPQFAFAQAQHTWVVVTFEALSPTTTKVRLRHFGFAEQAAAHADHAKEFEECRAYFSQAWPKVLAALAKHFETPTKN